MPPVVEETSAQIVEAVQSAAPQMQEALAPYLQDVPPPVIDHWNEAVGALVPGLEVPGRVTDPQLPPSDPSPVESDAPSPHGAPDLQAAASPVTVATPPAASIPSLSGLGTVFSGSLALPDLVFDPTLPRDVEAARRIIEAALTAIGLPYQWGGGALDGPTMGDGTGGPTAGFDCSGLTRFAVYQATGGRILLPRTSQVQFTSGRQVPWGEAQPGDLRFGNWQADGANHVAIYLGEGRMIEAPQTGQLVQISAVRSDMLPVRVV
ncbi:NlpC/P60 family protein [Rhodococcus sp. TAF43]|uniref:NlpC/P60 family protein n=1 Tax=Rhodococcus sp. TAF43 TaxID=3237483 RepID=UPI003F9E5518